MNRFSLICLFVFLTSCGINEHKKKTEQRKYLESLSPKEQIKIIFGSDTVSTSYNRAIRLLERDGNLHQLNEYIHYK